MFTTVKSLADADFGATSTPAVFQPLEDDERLDALVEDLRDGPAEPRRHRAEDRGRRCPAPARPRLFWPRRRPWRSREAL